MESELKKQLLKLKNEQRPAAALPDKSMDYTLLFDFKDSKRVDTDTVYELGILIINLLYLLFLNKLIFKLIYVY